MNCNELKRLFIDNLNKNIALHEDGQFEKLGSGFYQFEEDFPRFDEQLNLCGHSLVIAWNFWDSWIDECNHGFPGFYEGIRKETWPELAKQIVEKLEEDNEIDDSFILRHFAIEIKTPLMERIKNLFRSD